MLPELLQLVGQGIGGRSAYLLLPPSGKRSWRGSLPLRGWSKFEWCAEGNRTERQRDIELPEPLRTRLLLQGIPAVDPRGSFKLGDCESVVTLIGPHAHFLGYLGITYPANAQPESGRVRLLQDIVTNQLKSAALPRPETRRDLQNRVDDKLLPSLILVDESILCLNKRAVITLGADTADELSGYRLEDFISAAESELVGQQITTLIESGEERRFACTLVALNGTERRVELQCTRRMWRGSASVEIVVHELAQYRGYPDPLIETLSEAVWHVRIESPVLCSDAVDAQVRAIRRKGSLVEANRSFAKIIRAESIEHLLGLRVYNFLYSGVEDLITAFVESGYNLRGYEFFLRDADNGHRSFLINATGTVEDDRLSDIWGSCIEVTDRLEMERRSISLQEEQTERIGRDLHDSVAPLLTGMRLLSGDLIDGSSADAENVKHKIEKIANFAEQATHRLSEIYRGLVPRVLEESTLAQALQLLAQNADGLRNVSVRFAQAGDADLDRRDEKIQLYRIVQEALNNAIKHASAGLIRISLEKKNGRMLLQVCDDGIGFDAGAKKIDSLGLQNMRVRANTIGASFSIVSTPGTGTTISISLAPTL